MYRPAPSHLRSIHAAILALGVLGALATWMLVAPLEGDLRTRGVARVVRMAAQEWLSSTKSRGCPSYADLVQGAFFDPQLSGTLAAASVRITCDQTDVAVRWAGPDGDFDTSDDEAVPDPLGEPRPVVLSGFVMPLVVIMGACLSLAVATIVAGLRGWSRTPFFARFASTSGWAIVGIGISAGMIDLTVSQIAASRPGLSDADANRSLARGRQRFLDEAAVSVLVGAPGILLRPLRRRRTRANRATA